MNRAELVAKSYLKTYSNPAFNVGTGDFTVMAMIASTQGGTVISRMVANPGSDGGGVYLTVRPDGSIKLVTSNGQSDYQALTGPTTVLDGDCHTVAAIRTGATLSILVDGQLVPSSPSGTGTPPLNTDNTQPLTIGTTLCVLEPNSQFIGALMNVSIWSAALSGAQLVKAAFARVTGSEPGLLGYWTLDATTDDLSPNENPANIVGQVTFDWCLDCVWAEASNAYAFCQIMNMPGPNTPSTTVTLSREISVPSGAPAFGMAIMADQDTPAFPTGAVVTLTDPSGHVYNQDQNTSAVFAATSGGQLWALTVTSPPTGVWKVVVSAPATTGFWLTLQTTPSSDVVAVTHAALDPLYNQIPSHMEHRFQARSVGGFWGWVAAIAVGVVVGVIVAAVVVGSGGAAAPAVIAGVVAFAGVELMIANAAVSAINTDNLPVANVQVGGMAGFIVSSEKILLFDANVAADPATQITYQQRSAKLYPAVTASTFNKVQTQIVGNQCNQTNISNALTSFGAGYVTGSGHGMAFYLTGWYVSGNSGALQEILATGRGPIITPAQVSGKVFHFFACNCGYLGTDSPGLGRAMVEMGAVAFFGYKEPYVINTQFAAAFCACDIEIDLALIAGKTCADAYQLSLDKFNKTIRNLRNQGEVQAATQLENNRDDLVSPTTNAAYGNAQARLQIA